MRKIQFYYVGTIKGLIKALRAKGANKNAKLGRTYWSFSFNIIACA